MGQTGPGEGAQVHEDNGVKFESILRYGSLTLSIPEEGGGDGGTMYPLSQQSFYSSKSVQDIF